MSHSQFLQENEQNNEHTFAPEQILCKPIKETVKK